MGGTRGKERCDYIKWNGSSWNDRLDKKKKTPIRRFGVCVMFGVHQGKAFHIQLDFLPNLSQLLQSKKSANSFFFVIDAGHWIDTSLWTAQPQFGRFPYLLWICYLLKKYFQHNSLLGPDGTIFCLEFGLALHSSWRTGVLNDFLKSQIETKVEMETVAKSFECQ